MPAEIIGKDAIAEILINPDFIDATDPLARKRGFWMSQQFKAEFNGMDIGDVNRDGKNEVVVIDRHNIYIYQKIDNDLKLLNEIKGKFSICLFKKMMRVALPSFPSVFINLAFAKMSNLFIYQFSNELSLGLYSIAQKVGTLINLVGYAYRSAFLPFSMEIMHQENHKKDYNVFFRYAVLFFGIAAFTVT